MLCVKEKRKFFLLKKNTGERICVHPLRRGEKGQGQWITTPACRYYYYSLPLSLFESRSLFFSFLFSGRVIWESCKNPTWRHWEGEAFFTAWIDSHIHTRPREFPLAPCEWVTHDSFFSIFGNVSFITFLFLLFVIKGWMKPIGGWLDSSGHRKSPPFDLKNKTTPTILVEKEFF